MIRLQILPEAEAELRAASKQIEEERPGFGAALVREVRLTLERIRFLPHGSRTERGEIRVQSTARFPYRIYFLVRNDEILIVAIGHHRRRPAYWRSRVEAATVPYRLIPEAA